MVDMNISAAAPFSLSESGQMYLVTIARLRRDDQPVPLSQLADTLSISPVSANEMCRKLQDQGLVIYQPYRGASLTDVGEQRACYILRRHRLWEVLLVERLGFTYDEAHAAACQLEHATPDILADRLDLFLDYPPTNPLGEPIPRCDGQRLVRNMVTLTALSAGQRGQVIRCELAGAPQAFLNEQGIRPGGWLEVVAAAGDGLLVQVGQAHVALTRGLAETIMVEPEAAASKPSRIILDGALAAGTRPGPSQIPEPTANQHVEEATEMQTKEQATVRQIPLHTLRAGQRGVVMHVGSKGPVKRRMMDMGLVPGAEVSVRRVAPLGDPIEFTVKGYSLSLRKSEAQEIAVEVVE